MKDYKDKKTAFNSETFNEEEFFNTIYEILRKVVVPDDFKGNVFFSEDEPFSDIPGYFIAKGTFSWIIYDSDTPKSEFKALAEKIEKHLTEVLNLSPTDTVECVRYDDSNYTNEGYDVDLKLIIKYEFEE